MAEWSSQLVFEFLELYAAEPVLYNPKHPYHKNKKFINNAWERIQQGFSVAMPVSELKKKKDSLMASFRYQMRRKKEVTSIGEPVFKSTWFAFNFMYGFLGQIYENESAEDSEPVLEFVGFDALEDNSPNNDSPPTPPESNTHDIKQEVIEQSPSPCHLQLNTREDKPKSASKRKQPLETEPQEALDQASTASRNDEEDECDLYGRLIAKKLRKLPEPQRERLMYEIQGLFLKCPQYR